MTHAANKIDTPRISEQVLRAYDIRGVYGETLSREVAYWVGRAFATFIARQSGVVRPVIVTARDGRESSPILSQGLIEGLVASGAQVKDAGLGPSPLCYFGVHHLEADGGIMLTGSHNPPSHNGFKMLCGGKPFFGDDIQALGALINADDFIDAVGVSTSVDIGDAYLDALLGGFQADGAKTLRAVWDPGNGAAGEMTQRLIDRLPGEHIAINVEIDGTFPNHHPDPTVPENLVQLIDAVKTHKADIGLAFDGDGDRIGAVDAQGHILWGDQMMVLYAREILRRKPASTIIADVKASQTLFDDIASHGGQPVMWKTGHSLIKAKMKELNAELAGEMSGHIFFADGYFGFDDGLYAAVRLLNILAHETQSLAQLRESIPQVLNTPEIRIACDHSRKFAIVEEVLGRVKQEIADGAALALNDVDGARVQHKDGWWLVRASNTQSALIVRCEAQQHDTLAQLKTMVSAQLAASGVQVDAHSMDA